jgi:uncharacterized protein YbbC (DUF1343 family)
VNYQLVLILIQSKYNLPLNDNQSPTSIHIMIKQFFTSLLFVFTIWSFHSQSYDSSIEVGASQLQEYLPSLKGKKVAIVANQTSMIGSTHLVDSLISLGINVTKVFAPEHGFRGDADAGEKVKDDVDSKSGVPIISLYGRKNRKPSSEALANVDVILFDLQDVGVRFYTYISTMTYVMEACADFKTPIIVLDRPNPNGFYVDGPVLKDDNTSFIGMHKVPVVHGMTIGEYAKMVLGEKWLDNNAVDLTVVKCANYEHSDFYELPVAPSPNLPNMASIYLYPSLCLFEGTSVSIGRGTDKPFQQFGAPFIASTYSFTPKPYYGSKHPKLEGEICNGYNLKDFGESYIRNYGKLYLFWITAAYNQCDDKSTFFRSDGFFTLLTGDKNIQKMIEENKSTEDIWKSFQPEVLAFKKIRTKYLLYTDFE